MPNHIKTRITLHESMPLHLVKEIKDAVFNKDGEVDFSILIPNPKTEEYEKSGWYDWNRTNWGTKWNAYDTSKGAADNVIEFESAWSTPQHWLQALCNKFSDIHCTIEFADEDIGSNYGYLEVKNHKVTDLTPTIENPETWCHQLKWGSD